MKFQGFFDDMALWFCRQPENEQLKWITQINDDFRVSYKSEFCYNYFLTYIKKFEEKNDEIY